jgi:hypothetical protein
MRRSLATIGAAIAVAGIAPAAAQADALTYVDGHNVYVASADGAVKRQLTNDGHGGSYYAFPSLDDAGNITTIKGASTTRAIVVLRPDGSTAAINVMPWKTSTFGNIGPIAARVKPNTGSQVAYVYYRNHGPYSGYPNGGLEKRLAIVPPANPGLPTEPLIDQPGKDNPTWHGDKLVAASGGQIVYETQPLQFQPWLSDPTGSLAGAEVSRAGDRVLVAYSDGRLALMAYQGGIPQGQVTDGCFVPVGAAPEGGIDWALSPDGQRIAWADQAGLHVAATDPHPSAGGGPCALREHVLLSGSGKDPAFSAAAPPSNGQQGNEVKPPTGNDQGKPGVGPALTAPKATTTAALRRGLTVGIRVRAAGTVRGVLSHKGTVAAGKAVAKRAGTVRMTLRLTKAGKRRIASLRGKKLTLRVTFTPKKGGRKTVSTRSIKLR